MSDLENMAFLKLRPANDTRITEQVRLLLCDGERILQQYLSACRKSPPTASFSES